MQGCQMAIARFLDCMYVLGPHALALPGAIQGKEGIKFCHLATMLPVVSPEDSHCCGDVFRVCDGQLPLHGEEQHEAGRRRAAAHLIGNSIQDLRMEQVRHLNSQYTQYG